MNHIYKEKPLNSQVQAVEIVACLATVIRIKTTNQYLLKEENLLGF